MRLIPQQPAHTNTSVFQPITDSADENKPQSSERATEKRERPESLFRCNRREHQINLSFQLLTHGGQISLFSETILYTVTQLHTQTQTAALLL